MSLLCCAVAPAAVVPEVLELDTLHSALSMLYDVAQSVVRQYGGTLQPVTGERILALFGQPVAHEDHAQRALLAAIEIRQRLRQRHEEGSRLLGGTTLTARMGVHTGTVVVGGLGHAPGPGFSVVGTAVTLARVLQEQAAPGTIRCSATTAQFIRGAAHLEAMPPLHAVGHTTPEATYQVLAIVPQRVFRPRPKERPFSRFVTRALSGTAICGAG